MLRQPLESGQIMISRAAYQTLFPADFQLIAAMNPCPCGYFGDAQGGCRCAIDTVEQYRQLLSGPLLDRIDLHVDVPRIAIRELRDPHPIPAEKHDDVKHRIEPARDRMIQRQGQRNAQLSSRGTQTFCQLAPRDAHYLDIAMDRLRVSARGYYKLLKVARAIADLEDLSQISRQHLTEAISLRQENALCETQ